METTSGGGIGKMFGRAFSGESLFLNRYTAQGGEGIFNTVITGPGKIWLQSMPVVQVVNVLSPYFTNNK